MACSADARDAHEILAQRIVPDQDGARVLRQLARQTYLGLGAAQGAPFRDAGERNGADQILVGADVAQLRRPSDDIRQCYLIRPEAVIVQGAQRHDDVAGRRHATNGSSGVSRRGAARRRPAPRIWRRCCAPPPRSVSHSSWFPGTQMTRAKRRASQPSASLNSSSPSQRSPATMSQSPAWSGSA